MIDTNFPRSLFASSPMQALLKTYRSRPDLQKAYPEVATGHYQGLIDWAGTYGVSIDGARLSLKPYHSWYLNHASEEHKPLGTLLELYNESSELQTNFPEVLLGDYERLLDWACEAVASSSTQNDPIIKRLIPHKPWFDMVGQLPPKHLRIRVHGSPEPLSFVTVAIRCAMDIQKVLGEVNRELYSFQHVLDFGCGCGRVIRCFHDHPESCHFYGIDIDSEAISWCQKTINFAEFAVNKGLPPLPYPAETFDLIIANSVFTHLNEAYQFAWLKELHRIAKQDAILILTTHGSYYEPMLSPEELRLLKENGFYYKKQSTEGLPDFYGITWHTKQYVATTWSKLFKIRDHLECMMCGVQDAVVLEKVGSGLPISEYIDLKSQTALEVSKDDAEGTKLRKVIDARPYNSDKSQLPYLRIYEEYFEHLVDKEIKLLELGVYRGGSLLLWRDYFKKGTIVGLDMNPVSIKDPSGRIHVYQGYQQDTRLLDRIAMEQAPEGFDVIIDDCSHIGELTRISFWHLFENHLKPGGIYAIEDFGTGYLDEWPDGKRFELGVNDKSIWLRSRIIPTLRWVLNHVLYPACPPRLKPRLQHFVAPLGVRLSRVTYKKAIPSHMHGMVGFVKELVDACCLNSIEVQWGGGPQRPSRVDRLHISTWLVVIVKSLQ